MGRIKQKLDSLRTKTNVTFDLVNSSVSIVSNIGSLTQPYQRKVVLLCIVSNYLKKVFSVSNFRKITVKLRNKEHNTTIN